MENNVEDMGQEVEYFEGENKKEVLDWIETFREISDGVRL